MSETKAMNMDQMQAIMAQLLQNQQAILQSQAPVGKTQPSPATSAPSANGVLSKSKGKVSFQSAPVQAPVQAPVAPKPAGVRQVVSLGTGRIALSAAVKPKAKEVYDPVKEHSLQRVTVLAEGYGQRGQDVQVGITWHPEGATREVNRYGKVSQEDLTKYNGNVEVFGLFRKSDKTTFPAAAWYKLCQIAPLIQAYIEQNFEEQDYLEGSDE